ncbi:MAG: hypothetical protein QOE90_2682, partial [Thermoplasmata archaeon]|nr:hypothetical protein [Thermoplasmata archaeon]
MVGTEILLRGAAALVGLTFAVLLVPAIRRSRAALWLAVFLALVAANQLAETLRLLSPSADALAWFRLASVVASLDPLALYLFAANARPGAMRSPGRIAVVALPAFGLALWATTLVGIPFASNGPPADEGAFLFALALSVFTSVVYVGLLVWAIDGLLREPGRGAWSPLVFAIAVMAVPRIASFVADAYDVAARGPIAEWVYVVVQLGGSALLAAILVVALVARAFPRADARQKAVVAWALALGVAVTLGMKAQDVSTGLSVFFGAPRTTGAIIVGQTGTASRFLLFGAFASTALLRYDALGISLAARRRSARVLVALAFIIAGATLIPLAELVLVGRTSSLTTLDLGLLAAVIVLSQGFQRVVDRIASRVYGVPMPGDAAAGQEAYRRAVASAIAEGRDPGQDAELARLRDELGLDEATAAILARVADESEGGPLREGLHVGGRYRILRFLGAGGSGRAFLAEDTRLQRRVVLKEARDTSEGDAALAEARIAGGLANPH